ncbi:MAG: type IX secretion system membrane protein PorP/SprF [Bacteroidetes bacterium]|nr:type IX secretion system membrane protein PorP/SprF [Bacteroidota bacterium]
MKKTLLIWLGIAMLCSDVEAQDPQFSQFYANPLYLNPAFSGTKGCGRLNLNFRDQWPQLSGQFVTYSASYDQYSSAVNGGLGLLITSDNAGRGVLVTNRVGAIYSYIKNFHKDLTFSFALQADLEQKNLNSQTLILGDRYNPNDPNNLLPPNEIIPTTSLLYPDFSTGAMVYGKYFQAGMAVHHLLEPQQKYIVSSTSSFLPRKYTAHIGVNIPLDKDGPKARRMNSYISPQVIFQQQKDFQELNLGLLVKKGPISGGVWYRTRDALIVSMAIQNNNFRVGYSYDVTLSNLSAASVGSHEIAIGYAFSCKPKKKIPRAMTCPEGF